MWFKQETLNRIIQTREPLEENRQNKNPTVYAYAILQRINQQTPKMIDNAECFIELHRKKGTQENLGT